MSLNTQSKVLRVLEEQRFEPVGGSTQISVDVRVIAATNKRLEEEIEKGRFRSDLLYRLNVIPFQIPPLRERLEDVSVLAEHFNRRFSSLYRKEAKNFTAPAMDAMTNYYWPGNVRELKNTIERVVTRGISPKPNLPRRIDRCGKRFEPVTAGNEPEQSIYAGDKSRFLIFHLRFIICH